MYVGLCSLTYDEILFTAMGPFEIINRLKAVMKLESIPFKELQQ